MVCISGLVFAPLLVVFVGSQVLVTIGIVHGVREQLQKRAPPFATYTWIEDDVPEYFPVSGGRTLVPTSIEESVRYGIQEPEASYEWAYNAPVGEGGNVRLGPNHRLFVTSFAHQLHCLLTFRTLLNDEGIPDGRALHHSEHCLSFLRQHTLCAADTTLEPDDTFSRNFTSQRVIADRKCVRTESYYETTRDMWMEWVAFKHRSTNTSL
ncbi:hypothetical protein OH76DRAFT_307606 [Lentinus brumalis]|uniref:Oxidase ustYa n=1 Tax=Lentinus brumalis TaxID=2498619 RepID=A0A371CKB8_9APHY|nr:hypothetical protein OH76DRAFT_307606 [Polyporus brumalis]